MYWISPDGLGRMLNVSLDDGKLLSNVNPRAFGYRSFLEGPDGGLYSPFGYNGVPMHLGETVNAWYTLDDDGNPTSAIPREIQKQLSSYADLAKFGYKPVTRHDEIPAAKNGLRPVVDIIRSNYDRLSDIEKAVLRGGRPSEKADLLDKLLEGVLTDGEKRGMVLDANLGGLLGTNASPHHGFSLWGLIDPRFAIFPRWTLGNDNMVYVGKLPGSRANHISILPKTFVKELEKGGIISGEEAEKFYQYIKNGYNAGTDAVLNVALNALEGLEDIIPNKGDRQRLARAMSRNGAAYIPMNHDGSLLKLNSGGDIVSPGYISDTLRDLGHDIPEGDDDALFEAYDRFMRGQLLNSIQTTLWQGDDFPGGRRPVLVQVMAPLTSLVPNSAGDKVSAQTDTGNELRALQLTPKRIVTDASQFYQDLEKYNDLLAKPGMKAADAWHESFGDKYGDLNDLDSDERVKNVYKSMKKEVDNYISRKSILHGLTKGPGAD